MNADITLSALFITKLLVLTGLVLYAVFAAVVVRQETLMSGVLEESSESLLRILVLIHFFAALATILLAVIFL
jgi:hypothetical protein